MPAVTGRTKRLINVLYCARIAIVNNSCMKLSNSFFSSAFRFCRLNMCYDSLILHGCHPQPKIEGFLALSGSHCHTIEQLRSLHLLSYFLSFVFVCFKLIGLVYKFSASLTFIPLNLPLFFVLRTL